MAVVPESHDVHEHEKRRDLAWLLLGVSALIVALAFLILVAWQIGASVKATPFDADGVRCYRAASELVCIKTAEPPR
jgi:hypothetical protein